MLEFDRLLVPLGGSRHLQMGDRQPIRKAWSLLDDVVHVEPCDGDPTTVLVHGLAPDTALVSLWDADGAEETVEIIVVKGDSHA
jgi:hypothetical protein